MVSTNFVYPRDRVVIRMHISEMTIGSFPQITVGSYPALIRNARSSYGSDCLTTSKLSPNNAISMVYLNNPRAPHIARLTQAARLIRVQTNRKH